MRTALRIFRRDLKRILRNPIAVIVTLGVCIIPSLYAWFNIAANWDPYKNTSGVSVAVVSNDEGADLGGDLGYVNAGDMVLEKLAENDQLNWVITDEDDALDGVSSGRYYAAIVIPKGFTSDLASVLTGELSQPDIDYYVNEKVNPIAPKVTDTGASTIETQINETFVKTVTGVVVDKLKGASGSILGEANTTTDNVVTRIHDVEGSLDDLSGTIDDTNATIESARASIADAETTLAELEAEVDKANGSLADATGILYTARQDSASLSSSVTSSLAKATTLITGVSGDANAAIGRISGKVGEVQGTVDGALATAQGIVDENERIVTDLQALEPLIPDERKTEFEALVATLQAQVDEQQATVDRLETASSDISNTADAVSGVSTSVNDAISSGAQNVTDLQSSFSTTTLPQLYSALDSFSDASGDLKSVLASLSPTLKETEGVLSQLDDTLEQAESDTSLTKESISTIKDSLDQVATDLSAIQSSEAMEKISSFLGVDTDGIASFMATPVELDDEAVYPVANYGSGVAPFYTDLALWVGGFVLVAIYKIEVDDEGIGEFKPWQSYFGRWMLFMLLGTFQAIICCVGDLVMGIQCLDPKAFVFAGVVESFVYVNIIYAFSIAFKHVGKALCVLLVILQIPGSSGTYPIEMMPSFFQAIHPWLPFTYGINAMREAIAGYYGNYYPHNLLVLLLFVIPALLIGVGWRRHLLNINALFDKKLAQTDLMICEKNGITVEHYKISSIIRSLLHNDTYRGEITARAAQFELIYPKVIRWGFIALLALPIGLTVVMFMSSSKSLWFIIWIICLVALCAMLIITEYLHESMRRQAEFAGLSQEEMYEALGEDLDKEYNSTPLQRLRKRVVVARSNVQTVLSKPRKAEDAAGDAAHDDALTSVISRIRGDAPDEEVEVPQIPRATTPPVSLDHDVTTGLFPVPVMSQSEEDDSRRGTSAKHKKDKSPKQDKGHKHASSKKSDKKKGDKKGTKKHGSKGKGDRR